MDANKRKANCSPFKQPRKKSTLITQTENDRNIKIALLQQPRKKLSYSTFLDSQQVHISFTEKSEMALRNEAEFPTQKQEDFSRLYKFQRVCSQKSIADHKFIGQRQKSVNEVTQNTPGLKLEQIGLKYKSKISCLLKEIEISANEMIRFNNITKADEILNFLTLKVKERIVKSQITGQNFIRTRSKSKEAIKDHQLQRQILLTRLQQKEKMVQQFSNKLKHLQNQASNLRNDINQRQQREKELWSRVNQFQKQKLKLDEQQKLISCLQQSCASLHKENSYNLDIKKDLQLQNTELAAIIDQFKIQLAQYKQKHTDLLLLNNRLNKEIARWQQKYEDDCLSLYGHSQTDSQGDLSLASFAPSIKTSRLSTGSYAFAHTQIGNTRRLFSTSAQINTLRQRAQIETQYKKKIQQIIKDWKNKLHQVVNTYEDELQVVKEKNGKLLFQKQQLQRKVMALANGKCIVQTKLIQKQRQIYEMTKLFSSSTISKQNKLKNQDSQSSPILLGQQEIKPTLLQQVTTALNEDLGSLKAQVLRSN